MEEKDGNKFLAALLLFSSKKAKCSEVLLYFIE